MGYEYEIINSNYEVINSNLENILGIIDQSGRVEEYDYLIANRDLTPNPEYQRRYICFWQMNRKGFSPEWLYLYFEILQANIKSTVGLAQVVAKLWQIPATANGKYRLDFSFATKLIHMADPHLPVYDQRVADFYDFVHPTAGIFSQKLEKLMRFYNCLKIEYNRILEHGLLSPSIGRFRIRFSQKHCTDEKIVDYLIWAYIKWTLAI